MKVKLSSGTIVEKYVKTYLIKYSDDNGTTWKQYGAIWKANADGVWDKLNEFKPPIRAKMIRIYIKDFQTTRFLKFEAYYKPAPALNGARLPVLQAPAKPLVETPDPALPVTYIYIYIYIDYHRTVEPPAIIPPHEPEDVEYKKIATNKQCSGPQKYYKYTEKNKECAIFCAKTTKYFIFGLPYQECRYTKESGYKTRVCKCYCQGPLSADKCDKVYKKNYELYSITIK